MLDGAYVRAVPGYQTRNFEAICGKVEHEGCSPRRFALVRSVTEQPYALLRAALREQSWREGDAITVISDGDPALSALARAATQAPVETILDWFHLSMRVRHVEQTLLGLQALEPAHPAPVGCAQADVERLRSLLWNGRHEDASEALVRIVSWAESAALLDNAAVAAKAGRLVKLCTELRSYIENNEDALIDYGALRRRQADLDLACRGHGQPPGQRSHEQASADALDTQRRPPCAAGQGRGAGPTRRIRPAAHPARGVVPQVFAGPHLGLAGLQPAFDLVGMGYLRERRAHGRRHHPFLACYRCTAGCAPGLDRNAHSMTGRPTRRRANADLDTAG